MQLNKNAGISAPSNHLENSHSEFLLPRRVGKGIWFDGACHGRSTVSGQATGPVDSDPTLWVCDKQNNRKLTYICHHALRSQVSITNSKFSPPWTAWITDLGDKSFYILSKTTVENQPRGPVMSRVPKSKKFHIPYCLNSSISCGGGDVVDFYNDGSPPHMLLNYNLCHSVFGYFLPPIAQSTYPC